MVQSDQKIPNGIGMMSITDSEFEAIRKLVYDRIGICLTDRKRSLVVGRLQKLLRRQGFKTFRDYYDYVVGDTSGKALDELANRISTNHTYFCRENDHFEFFAQTVLPEVISRHSITNDRDIRIWCAASSTGEEPYNIVMTMMEVLGSNYSQWDAGLLATDISAQALQKAGAGTYSDEQMENLPAKFRNKHFRKNRAEGTWTAVDNLKREITFRRFNLMNTTFPFKKPFDIIFCRNVMIYFDNPTRVALVRRFAQSIVPGGYLFIGHSETLGREQLDFEYVKPAVYRRRGA